MNKMIKSLNKNQSGFTLIEILVVIGIIAILAAVVLIAINPARQFAQARDAERNSELNSILNAIGQKLADSKGVFADCLAGILTSTSTIYMDGSGGAGTVNLSCLAPTYMSALPVDPASMEPNTGYLVKKDASGRITVKSDTVENNIPRTGNIKFTR